MRPLLSADQAEVFYNGRVTQPRLSHPEGVLVAKDGAIWCGGEQGELYRIEPGGSQCVRVGCSGGFALGLCMDSKGLIYVCDMAFKAVLVFDQAGKEVRRLEARDGGEAFHIPNYLVLDKEERYLYVSDTRLDGPGIWRFDLTSGESWLWMKQACRLANGMALAPDGRSLYLVESYAPGVSRVAIREDGSAGPKEWVVSMPGDIPDGLAFDSRGRLYISCFHPTRIYRFDGELELVIEDPLLLHLHHATNIAFRGDKELFVANFGAWHISRISLENIL